MLTITAITRQRPAPCDHWSVEIVNDVLPQTVTLRGVSRQDLLELLQSREQPWWVLLALLWLRARLAGGFTFAQCLNVEIVG